MSAVATPSRKQTGQQPGEQPGQPAGKPTRQQPGNKVWVTASPSDIQILPAEVA